MVEQDITKYIFKDTLPKFIVPLGLAFNILNVIVYSRKSFKNALVCIFFKTLSINNLSSLIFFSIDAFKEEPSIIGINVIHQYSFICKSITYFTFVSSGITAWLLVFLSIDRFITIKYPIRPKLLSKNYFYVLICFLIYIFNILYNIPALFYYDLIYDDDEEDLVSNTTKKDKYCDTISEKSNKTFFLMDLLNSTVIPFTIMLFLSIWIINLLRVMKFRVKNSISKINERNKKDARFAFTIIILNLVFLVFYLPTTVFDSNEGKDNKLAGDITLDLLLVHFSIDFFIYLTTNSMFRNELFNLLHLKKYINPMRTY